MLSIGLGFLGVGAALFVVAYLVAVPTRRFLRTALDAMGTVVDLALSSPPDGGRPRYAIVVEFRTTDGAPVRWTERTASNPPIAQPGDSVAVKYDPTDPRRVRLGAPARLWLLPRLFAGLGAASIAVGAVLAVVGLAF